VTDFANPVSAVMQGIQDALQGVPEIPRLAFAPPNGGAPVDILNFFDDVPRSIEPPYIAVGPIGFQPAPYAGCIAAVPVRLRIRLYAYDTSAGREKAWTMAWKALIATDSNARRDGGREPFALPAPWAFVEQPLAVQAGDVINPIDPKCVFFDLDMVVGSPRPERS
jgi:hypothetical protein